MSTLSPEQLKYLQLAIGILACIRDGDFVLSVSPDAPEAPEKPDFKDKSKEIAGKIADSLLPLIIP